MKTARDNLAKFVDKRSRPAKAVIQAINGNLVNITLQASQNVTKGVEVIGSISSLQVGQEVSIVWRNLRPFVLSEGSAAQSIIYATQVTSSGGGTGDGATGATGPMGPSGGPIGATGPTGPGGLGPTGPVGFSSSLFTPRSTGGSSIAVPSGYSLVISQDYEIGLGDYLDINLNANMEIT